MSETVLNLIAGIIIGALASGFIFSVIAIARAGSLQNAFWGLTIAGRARIDTAFATKLQELTGSPMPAVAASPPPQPPRIASAPPAPAAPPKPAAPAKPTGEGVRLLALLQSEARLIDFLMEEIAFPDDDQGRALRTIQQSAKKVVMEHAPVKPIIDAADGSTVTVPTGFDPSAIRVTGNVTGKPPFKGSLQHPGWKVQELKLPPIPEGQDPFVLQAAEVELP